MEAFIEAIVVVKRILWSLVTVTRTRTTAPRGTGLPSSGLPSGSS